MTPSIAVTLTATTLAAALAASAGCAGANTAAQARSSDPTPSWLRACDPADFDDALNDALEAGAGARTLGTLADGDPIAEVTAGARRYVVTPGEQEGWCEAFEAPPPIRSVRGRFLGGDEALEARALTSVHCSGDGCTTLVALSREPGTLAFAARVSEEHQCARGVVLTAMEVFARHTSLVLTCRTPTGGEDYGEQLILFDVRGGHLTPPLTVAAGAYEALFPDELEEGRCPIRPAGWIRPLSHPYGDEEEEDEPVIQTFEPSATDAARGEGVLRTLRWSAERQRFEPLGVPIPRTYEARRCR